MGLQIDQQEQTFQQAMQHSSTELGKLDARLDEQTDLLTQAAQVSGHQRSILERLSQQIEAEPQPTATKLDRLTDIHGIGPVYAGLLYEGGIRTYQQLAAMTPDELRAMVNVPSWRKLDPQAWIEQAQLLASQQEKLESYG